MHKISETDMPKLLQWIYANQCFTRGREACRYMLAENVAVGSPLHYPLSAAIHVLYSRPFKKAHGIERIDPSFIPEAHKQAHHYLIDGRDKLFAHFDAKKEIVIEGIASFQPALVIEEGGDVRAQCLEITAAGSALEMIHELLLLVCAESHVRIFNLLQRNKAALPKVAGTYALHVDGGLELKSH